ncbi:hypothetical protein HDU98_001817 [Podochytrium sp. JEL0797]|nr:hypothetical protein HDU98_001817 [Podochytrium sp. JEL0797]
MAELAAEVQTTAQRIASIPRQLETPRLILRAFVESDAEAFHKAIEPALPNLRRWIATTVEPNTLENQIKRIKRAHQEWNEGTRFNYLVVEKASGEIVGLMGIFGVDWHSRYGSLGYWVVPSFEGKGMAKEAVSRLVELGKSEFGLERIAILCDVLNSRSAGLAKRLGFTYEGTLRKEYMGPEGKLTDTFVFSIVKGVEF